MPRRLLAAVAAGAVLLGTAAVVWAAGRPAPRGDRPLAPSASPARQAPSTPGSEPAPELEQWPPVRYRRSRAIGKPFAGRLVRGVRLPAEGRDFFTWDPVRRRSPDRWWRRFGHDRLIRTLLRVLRAHRRSFPDAPRVGVGDISRPHGGDFGPRYGGIGHGSHQNGLDVDVYYPRLDGYERAPTRVAQVDVELARDLVTRFVRAGARYVFVGPHTGLRGRRGVVQALAHHDDHLHVRLRPRSGGR
jgi:murein endopeptidase